MKLSSITVSEVSGSLRFDAKFHLSQHTPLLRQLNAGKWRTTTAEETFGRDAIWMPGRFSRVWASSAEHGKPLLVPYDAFRYLPWSTSYLSRVQVPEYQSAEVHRGTILVVRSGRNCGPVTMVDKFLESFVMSDDMLRVTGNVLSDDAFYFYAFLATPTGQELVRRDRNGSVIDHIGPDQLAALRYPLVDDKLRKRVSTLFREAFELREKGRLDLDRLRSSFLTYFKLDQVESSFSASEKTRRFTILRSSLGTRIDVEPHAPRYAAWRDALSRSGGVSLDSVASVTKPPSRYRTNYVDEAEFGVPMLNGRQIAQYRAIGLRHMSVSAFRKIDDFRLQAGTTLLTADGRAEENLADCALLTQERVGWAASGHVHRVIPRPNVHPGAVYLACSCGPVQQQLKALATGSVVDALSEGDVASVIVPYSDSKEALALANGAVKAWELLARANGLEDEATAALEIEFGTKH